MAKKEYTYEEICRDIVAKKFSPVYIMMGDEPFFMDRITDLLLENVLEESERDFNQVIDDVEISVSGCPGSAINS